MTDILFVDAEPTRMRARQRDVRSLHPDWRIYFAGSGKEALAILRSVRVDIIVSDPAMPGMDGIMLLHEAQAHYPDVARVILAGNPTTADDARALAVAHQWILEPCTTAALCERLARILAARELTSEPALLTAALALGSLPASASSLERLAHADLLPDDELLTVFASDPALAAKAVQLVGSGFLDAPVVTTSVDDAVRRLGSSALRALARAIVAAAEAARSVPRPAGSGSMAHVAHVAHLALAPPALADAVATSVLLGDIGRLIAPHATPIVTARLAGTVLGTWGLPDEVVMAIAYRHDPHNAPRPHDSVLASVVQLDAASA